MIQKITAVLAISSLLACQSEQKQTGADSTKNLISSEIQGDSLSYSYDSLKVYSKTPLSRNKEITDTAKATFTYPVFKDSKLNALIEEPALLTNNPDARKYKSYKDLATSFIQEFDKFKNENPETDHTWFKDVDIQVLPQRKNYLGLRYTFVEYAGGAHPNSVMLYKNYRTEDLKPILLSDLITDGKQAELTSIAEQIFRKNEKLSATQSLEQEYFFDKGIFALNDNFTITPEGLEFYYNPYEIRAYAYGSTEILIPYAAIKHILKPNAILPLQ